MKDYNIYLFRYCLLGLAFAVTTMCGKAASLEFLCSNTKYIVQCNSSFSGNKVTVTGAINTMINSPISGGYLVGVGPQYMGGGFSPRLFRVDPNYGPTTITVDMTSAPIGTYYYYLIIPNIGDIYSPAFHWGGPSVGFTLFSCTGKIVLKDGKWVGTADLVSREPVTLTLYANQTEGFAGATSLVAMNTEGHWETPPVSVNPSEFTLPATGSYHLKLVATPKGAGNSLVLDERDVPIVAGKATVIANVTISNPAGISGAQDTYLRINGVQYDAAPNGTLQRYEIVGSFKAGELIPVVIGAGLTGKSSMWPVPSNPGGVVVLDVSASVKEQSSGGGGNDDNGGDTGGNDDGSGITGSGTVPPFVGPSVSPPQNPVAPPNGPAVVTSEDTLKGVNKIQETIVNDGNTTRELTAEGFNKVLDELHHGTATAAEGFQKVGEATRRVEIAVREEEQKTRTTIAAGFNGVTGAIDGLGGKLDQLHDDLTSGTSSVVTHPNDVRTVAVNKEALDKLNPLQGLEIPPAVAPVLDFEVDMGVIKMPIHCNFGEAPYSNSVEFVRSVALFLISFGFAFGLIKIIGKAGGV